MKKLSTNLGIFSILLFLSFSLSTYAQKLNFPGKQWKHVDNVEEFGALLNLILEAREK